MNDDLHKSYSETGAILSDINMNNNYIPAVFSSIRLYCFSMEFVCFETCYSMTSSNLVPRASPLKFGREGGGGAGNEVEITLIK